MAKEKQTNPVIIKIPKGEGKKAENLTLYLVDKQGNVIESHSLKSGEVRLRAKAEDIQGKVKVYIAPELPSELSKIKVNEKTLLKMGAWQPSFRLPPDNIFQLPYFPAFHWPLPFGWCNITGTVTKTFTVNGVSEVLPICDAIVHICDVDRIWWLIYRIPDDVLNDLRDRLTSIIQIPVPVPDPEAKLTTGISNQFRALANTSELRNDLPNRPELPKNVQNGILSGSMETFRSTIANNFELFHPYFCWWPWFWPWFYEYEEIATVKTDCSGRFDYNMFYFLKNHPNVYVWVELCINGSLVTIYKPWISCHTYWNYSCGTDINISVTNPAVLPCFCDNSTIEPEYIWIDSVNSTSIRGIQQFETASGHLTNAVGLTAYGGYGNISPFGSSFPFWVHFGDGLDVSFGITHYRWSYIRLTDAYLTPVTDSKHLLGGNVSKPYYQWIEITPGDWENLPGSFALGPYFDTSGNVMYKIPHTDAFADVAIAGAVWDTADDTASVNINSVGWNPGLYQFTIELLDNNGVVVPLAKNPFKVTRLPGDPPPAVPGVSTIDADGLAENYVIKDINGKIIGFNFLMRIDNDYCYAGISDALVAGATTDTECGIGYYNPKNNDVVDLIFQAGHPHNFATYSFSVYKGNSGAVSNTGSAGPSANSNNSLVVTSGNDGYDISQVDISSPPIPEYPVSKMDQYHKSILVSDMLGNCTIAAFSENLSVWATHTDGNTRIGYDAQAIAAIAIAPKT